jgi:2-succinyl-5-enolpyruvyl-6-hydroxy-3-cyclohexene-1-carboxylate synthase
MRAANPSHALAVTLIDELARSGVEHVCISPGSRSAPLALACADHEGLRTHVILDERSAAFVALGIAKATQRPAAVVCTSGTAAANLHPAVIEAHHSGTPLIVLTADRPPELRATGATQTIDQLKLFGDAVRWFVEVGVAEPLEHSTRYWRSIAARACITARGSPAGPVHLNVALREPLVPLGDSSFTHDLGGRPHGAPWVNVDGHAVTLNEIAVASLARTAGVARRGVIVAGAGRVEWEAVEALASAAGWPVLAEAASGLRRGDNAVTTYDAMLRSDGFRSSHRPDLVLRLGAMGTSRALADWLGPDIPQVTVDPDLSWADAGRATTSLVRADAGAVCRALLREIPARGGSDWLESWLSHERRARAVIDAILDDERAPSEPRTARDVAAALPRGATLVVAASMPSRDLDWFGGTLDGLRILANRGANGIDGFVSTTLGVALASSAPVVSLTGDLSLLHDQSGLLLARRNIDATFVVLNNDGGGVFEFLPQSRLSEHFERLFATPQGVDLAALARLHGCGHSLVGEATDLPGALDAAGARGGVHLVEIRTSRAANAELHHRIWRAVAAAVG